MKTIIQLTLILALIGAIMAFTNKTKENVSDNQEFAFVQIVLAGIGASITITYADGQTETVPLEANLPRKYGDNGVKINGAFSKLAQKGYKLITSNGGEAVSRYVFVKGD